MRLSVRTAAALLVLATLAAYANSFGGAWIFDDLASVVNNPTIRAARTAFFPPNAGGVTVSGRPLLNASFAVSYALSSAAPWGHHVVNLLIHAGAGLVLFGLVRRTLLLPSLAPRCGKSATPLAFTVALLWTVHPLQTESVTYIVQRAESLMGLFVLLTLYCAVRSFEAPSDKPKNSRHLATRWSVAAVVSCLLGVGVKEVTVVAPVLVLLHDRTFAAGSFIGAWQRRRGLYFGLFATWIPLAALVLGTGGNRGGTSGFDVGITAVAYWLTQFEAVTRYLALSVWPHPLVFEYGTFWTHGWTEVVPFALVVAPLAVATAWALWRRPVAGFFGAWFLILLSPTSIMPGTLQMIVEHRMYLPLAAVLAPLVLAAHAWLGRRALWLGLAVAVAFAGLTMRRNLDYRSELTLWADTVAKRPANAAAHNGLGLAQLAAGDTPSALVHLAEAVRLAPTRADYAANYAGALARAGRPADAIARYEDTLRLKPDYADAHANVGLVLGENGRLDDALAHGETAVRLAPGSANAHGNLGVTLVRAGRAAEAADHLQTSLQLDPDSPEVHNSLGVVLINLGRAPEAAAHFEAALRLRPDYPSARDNLRRLQSLLAAPPAGPRQ